MVLIMVMKYFLGSDIGTSSCKTVIIDSNGDIVGQSSKEYWPTIPKPGLAEINPDQWYRAFLETLKSSYEYSDISPEDISAIGLTGQMVSLVCVDKCGNSLRPAILWYDKRGSDEILYIESKIGRKITEINYNPLNSTFTLPKLLWVKINEPEIFKKIYKILWASDYVRMRLTQTFITDPTNASSSLMYNLKKGEWSQEVIDELEIPIKILPFIRSSTDIAGRITKEVSSKYGLKTGTPVIVGTGDVSADNLAAGITCSGQGMIRFGTCATISISLKAPVLDIKGKCPCSAHSIPGLFLLQGTSAAFGSSIRWFRDSFYMLNSEIMSNTENIADSYNVMDAESSMISPGANGLFFHSFTTAAPYWVPNMRGQFTGINESHKRGHFARAIFEGTSFDLKEALINLSNINGVEIPCEFIAVGGGTLSKTWCQIISNILGCNLLLTKKADASLGAAILAGVGVGEFSDLKEAVKKSVCYLGKVKFDANIHKYYKQRFKEFRIIHKSLAEICKSIDMIGNK